MVKEKTNLETEVVTSEDGQNTYEIRRRWREGRKALVIELYPTITRERGECWDLSTLHLMSHASELGWGEIRIINLYSKVFSSKPVTADLKNDVENIAYIEEILESDDIREYDIVIAWGSSLATHTVTTEAKIDLLTMLKEKGLEGHVKHIVTDCLCTNKQTGTHPLYLGLHFSKDEWKLLNYPLNDVLKELKKVSSEKKPKVKKKKGRKTNVLQN